MPGVDDWHCHILDDLSRIRGVVRLGPGDKGGSSRFIVVGHHFTLVIDGYERLSTTIDHSWYFHFSPSVGFISRNKTCWILIFEAIKTVQWLQLHCRYSKSQAVWKRASRSMVLVWPASRQQDWMATRSGTCLQKVHSIPSWDETDPVYMNIPSYTFMQSLGYTILMWYYVAFVSLHILMWHVVAALIVLGV